MLFCRIWTFSFLLQLLTIEKIRQMNTEDRWIIASLILSFVGVVSAALLKDPGPIGISVFVILALLILACYQTRSPRLAWLLVFGALQDSESSGQIGSMSNIFIRLCIKIILDSNCWPLFIYAIRLVAHHCAIRIFHFTNRGTMAEQYSDHAHHLARMALPPWYEQFAAPAAPGITLRMGWCFPILHSGSFLLTADARFQSHRLPYFYISHNPGAAPSLADYSSAHLSCSGAQFVLRWFNEQESPCAFERIWHFHDTSFPHHFLLALLQPILQMFAWLIEAHFGRVQQTPLQI